MRGVTGGCSFQGEAQVQAFVAVLKLFGRIGEHWLSFQGESGAFAVVVAVAYAAARVDAGTEEKMMPFAAVEGVVGVIAVAVQSLASFVAVHGGKERLPGVDEKEPEKI